MPLGEITSIEIQPQGVTLTWENGERHDLPAVWWLHNSPSRIDSQTGQRLVDILDLPMVPRIASGRLTDGALEIEFDEPSEAVSYPVGLLRSWLDTHHEDDERERWTGRVAASFPEFPYESVREDAGQRLEWLSELHRHGIVLLRNVPVEDGMVTRVVEWFGFVRETNYGRYFRIQSVPEPASLVHTRQGLLPHTDNPYRRPVPGLQLLHCMYNEVEGGESIFVDGLQVAAELEADAPEAYRELTRHPVTFRYRDSQNDLQATRRIIRCDSLGRIVAIHYSPRSIRPPHPQYGDVSMFYEAYRQFAQRVADPRLQHRNRFQPGDLLIFDNHRLLHGRFPYQAEGRRELQCCYAEKDGFLSTLQMRRWPRPRGRKRGQVPKAGTALRVLCTLGTGPLSDRPPTGPLFRTRPAFRIRRCRVSAGRGSHRGYSPCRR